MRSGDERSGTPGEDRAPIGQPAGDVAEQRVGAPAGVTTRYLSVRVGEGHRIHLKAQRATITLCGLGSELLGGRITLVTGAADCPACLHFVKHPQAGA